MTATVVPQSDPTAPEAHTDSATFINPLMVLHLLRSAGGGLLAQLALYGQLFNVEWALEKRRLFRTVVTGMLAFALLLCLLSLVVVLVLALSWDTPYRIPAVIALVLATTSALAIVWRHFMMLQLQGQQAFIAIRQELADDLALLKEALTKSKS